MKRPEHWEPGYCYTKTPAPTRCRWCRKALILRTGTVLFCTRCDNPEETSNP